MKSLTSLFIISTITLGINTTMAQSDPPPIADKTKDLTPFVEEKNLSDSKSFQFLLIDLENPLKEILLKKPPML